MKFSYTILDVFTSTRYAGNPLAIVELKSRSTPSGSHTLTQTQKQAIAKEFNLSETVFLYGGNELLSPLDIRVEIDIFTPLSELPFAGHPTIGVAWLMLYGNPETTQHLISLASSPSSSPIMEVATASSGREEEKGRQFSLLTKAGPVPIQRIHSEPGFVTAQIPHDIHIHAHTVPTPAHLFATSITLSTQTNPHLQPNQNPIISIVKSVSFILVHLPSTDMLEKATASLVPNSRKVEGFLDDEWKGGMLGTMFYVAIDEGGGRPGNENGENAGQRGVKGKKVYRTRMWVEFEDAATGSASCALGAYLALQSYGQGSDRVDEAIAEKGNGNRYAYSFIQGVEMGSKSELGVEVVISEGVAESIFLSGTAVKVMEGELEV